MRAAVFVVLWVLLVGSAVHAQELTEVGAGITPDTPLWKLDIMVEKIQVMLTFSPEEKVKKQLVFAEERLAEAEELASENKTEYAVVALEHEKTLLQEINRTSASIDDESGLGTVIEMLERHRQRLEQRREAILEKLPEDSPAREKLEQAFERIEEHSEAVEEHIRSVRKMHREQMKQVLDVIEEETGIDAESQYEQLMEKGTVDSDAIRKGVAYINQQLSTGRYNLSPLAGKRVLLQFKKGGQVTMSIVIYVYDDASRVAVEEIAYGPSEADADIKLTVNVADVPKIIMAAWRGDEKALVAYGARAGCDVECVSIARKMAASQGMRRAVPAGKMSGAAQQGIYIVYIKSDAPENECPYCVGVLQCTPEEVIEKVRGLGGEDVKYTGGGMVVARMSGEQAEDVKEKLGDCVEDVVLKEPVEDGVTVQSSPLGKVLQMFRR